MTRVLFARIPEGMSARALSDFVRKSFPHKENKGYFDSLENRKNRDGVKESFAALALLRELLSMRGIETDRLVFRRSESGKPYFEDTNLHFSLSHSKGYVAAALSDTTEVGIDIECADVPRERAEKMIKRFFCKDCKGCEGCESEFSEPSPLAAPSLSTTSHAADSTPTDDNFLTASPFLTADTTPTDDNFPTAAPFLTADTTPTDDIPHTAENFVRIWTKAEAYAKMLGIGLGKAISNRELPCFCTEKERGESFFYYFNADGYPLTACLEKPDGEIDFCKRDLENLIKKAEI